MQTTWITKTGKNVELNTSVVGKTAHDHIYTQYALTVDGKPYKVIGPAIVKGQHCLEILIGGTSKQMLAVDGDIVAKITDELRAVRNAVENVDISISKYDQGYEKLTRLMGGDHSDY